MPCSQPLDAAAVTWIFAGLARISYDILHSLCTDKFYSRQLA